MPDISPISYPQSAFLPLNSGAGSPSSPRDACLNPNGSMRNAGGQDSLATACQDFEAVLVNYLLKTMRESVPKSGFLEEGNGAEFYRGLMDWEIATKASRQGQFGLWKTLYRQLAGHDPEAATHIGKVPGPLSPVVDSEVSGGAREIPMERTTDHSVGRTGSGESPLPASEISGADDSP